MKKKVVKIATCCLASSFVIACSAMTVGAQDSAIALPSAGISFSFNGENSLFASAISEVVNNEVNTVKSEFENIAIAQVDNYVNVRDIASEEGEIVGKLYDDSAATVLATEGEWYKISSGNVTGYVKSEFVVTNDEELARKVGRRVAIVNTQTLRVREEASVDSKIVELVPKDEELTVTDESIEGWVGISVADIEGYVSTEFVDLKTVFVQAESKAEEEARLAKEEAERKAAAAAAARAVARNASVQAASYSAPDSYDFAGSGSGGAVASYACQFIGRPYVYGGSSLTNGTDCSGFVMSVYGQFGVGLPHSSSALRSVGYGVSYSEAQPGDIICYSGHVGIYIGGGQIVHASTPATGICIGNATYSNILAVRRIF